MLQPIAEKLADILMAIIPRRKPGQEALNSCKVISHRGEHINNRIPENSMQAFQTAVDAGVWGIETDIRWTADLVPVIIHDPDAMRVFGKPVTIAETRFDDLRSEIPGIPTLAELIDRFGGKVHLMLELKQERFPDIERQKKVLLEHLSGLAPKRDYHMLSLQPELFEIFDIQPRDCCLPVAFTNYRSLSDIALRSGYGGLSGHYLLLNKTIKTKHEKAGQKIGTGFIASRNCLYREINRRVEWIFSNEAVKLMRLLREDGVRADQILPER